MSDKRSIEIPGFNTVNREEIERRMAEHRKAQKKKEHKEKRERRHAFIRNGMRITRLPARGVIWIMRNFSSIHHSHWDGRIGG